MSRVLIVEDHPDDRAYLTEAIENHPELELAGWAGTCSAAIDELNRVHVDTVILDLVLPDGSGSTVLKHARSLGIPALVMTVLGDERSAAKVIAQGAAGYLLKDSDADSITESIMQVLNGAAPLNPRVARYLLDRLTSAPAVELEQVPALSACELRVLELIARGYSDKECAAELHRSVHTIATHIKHIFSKLSVHSRAQAISTAIAYGLIDTSSLLPEQAEGTSGH